MHLHLMVDRRLHGLRPKLRHRFNSRHKLIRFNPRLIDQLCPQTLIG